MPAPYSVRALSHGRYQCVCGACLASSPVLSASDLDAAWSALRGEGWGLRHDYATCPACTTDPPSVERNAAEAMRRRKRK